MFSIDVLGSISIDQCTQNLDVQYAIGLATGVPVTFLSVGGEFDDALLDTANYLLSLESPPPVVATSYGDNENAISQKLA